jgi:hypothetical protein
MEDWAARVVESLKSNFETCLAVTFRDNKLSDQMWSERLAGLTGLVSEGHLIVLDIRS